MGYIPVGSGGETKYEIVMSYVLLFIFLVVPPVLALILVIMFLYNLALEIF